MNIWVHHDFSEGAVFEWIWTFQGILWTTVFQWFRSLRNFNLLCILMATFKRSVLLNWRPPLRQLWVSFHHLVFSFAQIWISDFWRFYFISLRHVLRIALPQRMVNLRRRLKVSNSLNALVLILPWFENHIEAIYLLI